MDHPKDQPLCLVDWTSRVGLLPGRNLDPLIQVELWKGSSITIAKELPELLEAETDIYEASQKLKETKQRFWERKKGGGKGEKGKGEKGKGKGKSEGKGKDGGNMEEIQRSHF